MLTEASRQLYNHLAECLGLQDRKIARLVLTFDTKEGARIQTDEFIEMVEAGPLMQHKQWRLLEDNGNPPTKEV